VTGGTRQGAAAPCRLAVQRKPTLGGVGDRYEAEADGVAHRVVAGERSVAGAYGSLLRYPVDGPDPGWPATESDGSERIDSEHVESARGGGRALDGGLRSHMEMGFGVDFGHVTIHTGSAAAAASAGIHARAFTQGSEIYFGRGEYRPHSASGRTLIAHELTHTLQQGRENTVRRSPLPEKVEQLIIYTDSNEVLVITDRSRYRYRLTRKDGLVKGTYKWKHTQGTSVDAGKDVVIERPAESTAPISWRIAPELEGQPSWADFGDSEFTMIVLDSSRIHAGEGEKAGEGTNSGQGQGQGKGAGGGRKKEATDPEKEASADRFLTRLREKATSKDSDGITREKLKELVGHWAPAEMDEFFELFDQASSEHPLKSMEELLAWYAKLTPSQREILRVNKMLGESLAEDGPARLPEDIQLMITTGAKESADVVEKVTDTNRSLEAIRRKVHEVDPERARNFEKLDPQKLTAFNQMMALEAMLAGASERSPEIEGISRALTGNIRKIRHYILEELAWLSAELGATTLLSILAAPISAGATAAVGAARAALLIVRLNRLRKLLDAIEKIRAVSDTLERVKGIFDRVKTVTQHRDKLEEYRKKFDELMEMKRKIVSAGEEVGEKLHDDMDALEDEILDLVRGLVEAEGGLGQILDVLYLPEDAGEEELRKIILDLPRGLEAAEVMLDYYERMQEGDLESTKVLMFKAYAAGYLLYPLVGYIADLANEQLDQMMGDTSLKERLTGIFSKGIPGGRKGKGAANRKKFKEVRKKEQKKKEEKKDAAGKTSKDDEAKKKKNEEGDEKLSKDDRVWRELGHELQGLPQTLGDGATGEEALRAARKLTGKPKYKKVAGGVDAASPAARPAQWEVTVRRRGGRGTPHVVHVLKSPRTRYIEIRSAIRAEFRNITDQNRTPQYIQGRIDALKARHEYPHIRVEPRRQGDTETGWQIQGQLPGSSYNEILTIDSAEHSWGSESNPIPMDWPKPNIADYPKVFVGPPVREKVKLKQADLKDLKGSERAEREAFADAHADPSNQKDIDAWKNAGATVQEFAPTSRKALPSPSTSTIGVTVPYQVKPQFKFKLEPKGSTPGGGKILGPLAKFGYSATGEATAGDHVKEYSLGGPDERENLWPLDARMNSSSRGTLRAMSFPGPGGGQVFKMDELKKKAKKSGKTNEVWFKITSVRPPP